MSGDGIDPASSTGDDDEDWLESDNETEAPHSSAKGDYAMATRDTYKVHDKMYDVSAAY